MSKKKLSDLVYSQMNNKTKKFALTTREHAKSYKENMILQIFKLADKSLIDTIAFSKVVFENSFTYILDEYAKTGEIIAPPKDKRSIIDVNIVSVIRLRELMDLPHEKVKDRINSIIEEDGIECCGWFKHRFVDEGYKITTYEVGSCLVSMREAYFNTVRQVIIERSLKLAMGCFIDIQKDFIENQWAPYNFKSGAAEKLHGKDWDLYVKYTYAISKEILKTERLVELFRELFLTEAIKEVDKFYNEYDFIFVEIVNILFKNVNFDIEKIINKQKEFKYRSWRELESIANNKGFRLDRCNGDHGIYINKKGKVVVIPRGREIGKGLQIHILKTIEGTLNL